MWILPVQCYPRRWTPEIVSKFVTQVLYEVTPTALGRVYAEVADTEWGRALQRDEYLYEGCSTDRQGRTLTFRLHLDTSARRRPLHSYELRSGTAWCHTHTEWDDEWCVALWLEDVHPEFGA